MDKTEKQEVQRVKEIRDQRKSQIIQSVSSNIKKISRTLNKNNYNFIEDSDIYNAHATLIKTIGNSILQKQGKTFVIDENNKNILKFLLYYFNSSDKALDVFPNEGYCLDKQLMIIGDVGAGKTLIMQIFAEYTTKVNSDNKFINVSTSQMMNYYKINNHLNSYTFNEGGKSFDGNPYNLCLNDLGLSTHKHYGNDLKELVKDFLYSRNDIYVLERKMAHITTNLAPAQLTAEYSDEYGRLKDRFKTYNVIHLKGESKR